MYSIVDLEVFVIREGIEDKDSLTDMQNQKMDLLDWVVEVKHSEQEHGNRMV